MPFPGWRGYEGRPQFAAVAAHDPLIGIALDARPTDVCVDCCEEGRAEPLDCGGLRYTQLLGETLCCGSRRFTWVPVAFIGPTRRGDAPYDPPPFEPLGPPAKLPLRPPRPPTPVFVPDGEPILSTDGRKMPPPDLTLVNRLLAGWDGLLREVRDEPM